MLYAKRTPAGHLIGLATNPFEGSIPVNEAEAAAEIALFRAWGTSDPADIARLMSAHVNAEFRRRVEAALQGKSDSIAREALALQNLAFRGVPLTAEQQSDVALILAINDWETAMIEARQALIELADPSFADDSHWPAPPAGLTAAWLTGF